MLIQPTVCKIMKSEILDAIDLYNTIPEEFTCRATGRATFKVYKDFDDNNPSDVIVHLDCTTGLIPDQDQNVSENNPITFVLTDFDGDTADCDITESVPAGYSAKYSLTDNGAQNSIECAYENVTGGSYECWIENQLNAVEVEVTKDWIDEHSEFNNSTFARARASCINEFDLDDRHLRFYDDGDKDSFFVKPSWQGDTECWVNERIRDSGVESDSSDCQDIEVVLGDTLIECTIVNTRIYEGVPTLSQYGLALMALLMLGVGLVGFRRFA